MEQGKSKGFADSIDEVMATDDAATMGAGSTKTIEVNRERSES